MTLHDPSRAARHVRHGRLDALARDRGRDVGARARRQRLRRCGRGRLHAAGRRAAPERARRRPAGRLLGGRARRAARALRAGRGAGRRDDRALPRARPRARARHGPPRGVRPGRLRRLADACSSEFGTLAARRRARARDRLRGARVPGRPRDHAHDRARRRPAARVAGVGRALPAGAPPGRALPQPGAGGDVPAARRGVARRLARAGDRARAGGSSTRASSPRRSTASRRAHGGLLTGDDLADVAGDARAAGDLRLPRAHGAARRRPGARARCSSSSSRCSTASTSTSSRSAEYVHTVVECAKLAFADREAFYGDVDVPLERLLSRDYNDERRLLVGDEASAELRPGGGRLPRLVRAEPTVGRRRADAGRHRPPRRRRPLREPRLGDAERRLAAELAGDPGARLAAGIARADVLAGGRPAVLARAAEAPANDALALARAARRRAVPRLRHAGRRPAGPVDAARLPAPRQSSATTCRRRSTRRASTPTTSRRRSIPRQARPRSLSLESRWGGEVAADLRRRGHDVEVTDAWSLGRVSAVARGRDGVLQAGANPRGMQGYAAGR